VYRVRHVAPDDSAAWAVLRRSLWPESTVEEHAAEIGQFFAGELEEPHAVMFAVSDDREIAGLIELSERRRVPGCRTERVGFIEGLYVVPGLRHRGVARMLIRAAKDWARQSGCTEFASDRTERFIIDRRYDRSIR
jgi:aminoglycoside 6'-N-acetyltransferase I